MPATRRTTALTTLLLAVATLSAAPYAAAESALRRSSIGEPQTLDPQLWTFGQDGNLAQDLFQGLTTVDAAARTVPGAARSWVISADGKSYRFSLYPDLRWSDGAALTSADFLYSFRRLFDPRSAAPGASLLYVIRNGREVNTGQMPVEKLGVSAPDALTIVIELEHPAPYLLDLLVHRAFPVPRHVLEKHGRDWTKPGNLVSNGAFVLAEWRPNSHVKLARNARFRDAATVRLDAVYHLPIEDPKAALTRYKAGELDIAVSLPSEQIAELRREFGSQLRLVQQVGLEYYAFNVQRAPFNDPRVRHALAMAIDRDLLSSRILLAGEPAAYCLVPPGVENYRKVDCADYVRQPPAARLNEARRLLAAAGYSPSKPLAVRLRYNNNDTQRKIALVVAAMWQPLGVRTELITADLRAHQIAIREGDFDVARASWYAEDLDAISFLRLLDSRAPSLNISGYREPRFEALLDQADASADLVARAGSMAAAEKLAMGEQPIAPLYYYVSRRLISPRVQGWVDNPRGVHINRYLSIKAR